MQQKPPYSESAGRSVSCSTPRWAQKRSLNCSRILVSALRLSTESDIFLADVIGVISPQGSDIEEEEGEPEALIKKPRKGSKRGTPSNADPLKAPAFLACAYRCCCVNALKYLQDNAVNTATAEALNASEVLLHDLPGGDVGAGVQRCRGAAVQGCRVQQCRGYKVPHTCHAGRA